MITNSDQHSFAIETAQYTNPGKQPRLRRMRWIHHCLCLSHEYYHWNCWIYLCFTLSTLATFFVFLNWISNVSPFIGVYFKRYVLAYFLVCVCACVCVCMFCVCVCMCVLCVFVCVCCVYVYKSVTTCDALKMSGTCSPFLLHSIQLVSEAIPTGLMT